MAGTVRTEIRGLPAEIVVQIMACMPSPIALLDFLTAFTSVIELFEKFHSEILDQVLIIEAPPMVQKMIAEGGKPVSYEFARACSQDAERWNAPALKVPSLRKPHLTLMTIVLDCATGPETKEAKSLRKELEAMGADMNLCYEYTRYWKFRLVHEEAVAVLARGPPSEPPVESDPDVEKNLEQRPHLTWQQRDEIREGRFGAERTVRLT